MNKNTIITNIWAKINKNQHNSPVNVLNLKHFQRRVWKHNRYYENKHTQLHRHAEIWETKNKLTCNIKKVDEIKYRKIIDIQNSTKYDIKKKQTSWYDSKREMKQWH